MASFITPFRPIVNEWDWNPGQTFVTSFMLAQENKRAQEKAAQEAELMKILLPYKQQTAALELEKLQQEVERSTLLTKKLREGGRSAHQAIMEGLQNDGSSASGTSRYRTSVRVKNTGNSMQPVLEPSLPPQFADDGDIAKEPEVLPEEEDVTIP